MRLLQQSPPPRWPGAATVSVVVVTVPPIDPVAVAVERAIDEIERELGMHLDVHKRIGVTLAIERFEAVVRFHTERCDPWC